MKWELIPCLGNGKQDVMKVLIFFAVRSYNSFSNIKSIILREPDT